MALKIYMFLLQIHSIGWTHDKWYYYNNHSHLTGMCHEHAYKANSDYQVVYTLVAIAQKHNM